MKRVKFGVSGHFLENAWREWPEILHADVSWPPSELISSRSRSVDFCHFGTILTWWNRSNLVFPGISWRTHWGNGLKYGVLLYPDHLQNWLDYGYGLVIYSNFGAILILVKRVKFGVSRHFLENPLRKWPEILNADVSSPLSELITIWLQFVDFSNFDAILT